MKKSIAIDGNEANIRDKVGTGEYTYNILTRWAKNPEQDFHIYLRSSPLSDMPEENDHWHYHVIGPYRGWTRLAFPYHLLTGLKHNVVWNPAHYLPPFTRCPGVVTVHDLAYEFYPELFLRDDLYKLKKWTKSSVERAASVIAVSSATKNDIVKLYGIPEKKVVVVSNGYDSSIFYHPNNTRKEILERYKLQSQDYLLFVGTLQPRKNLIKLVQAFHLLKEDGYKGKLVIAGKIGWMAEETLSTIKSSAYADDIIMTGYIDIETKRTLYAHASTFVMPSFYEGFGVPVLEAMASGCPVASANNSSLPEVVGNAGVLFDAHDPADIARAIKETQKNRDNLVKKGYSHIKNYSWDKCAEATLDVLLKTAR